MFIDTHCHILKEYYENIDLLMQENRESDVRRIVVSGCELDSMDEVIALSKQYADIYLTLGFHPSEVKKVTERHLQNLEKLLKSEKVVGIGEIGLDYHYGKEDKKAQQKLFEQQLVLAEKLDLPVVIHSRDATQDTMDILKRHSVRGIIHCFSGSIEVAHQYVAMGFLLGIGGVVTFKNSNLSKVIATLDISSIVLETDSPYLTPEPFRGKQNSSKYIPFIAQRIAEIKAITVEEVMEKTTQNASCLFDFS